jgi:hypothetical protein
MNDDQMRELFREMRDEPVPADSLVRVRARVTERTSSAPRRRFTFAALALAMGLAAIFAVSLIVPKSPPNEETRTVTAKAVEPKIEQVAKPAVAEVRPTRQRVAKKATPAIRRASQAEPGGAVAIRIETADPDVLIIFLSDGPGI